MARKATTTTTLDSEVAKELEEALDIDLFVDDEPGGLDVAGSMAEFEAQISKAAEDLARDSRASAVQAPAPEKKTDQPPSPAAAATKPAPAGPKPAANAAVSELRPLDPPAPVTPSAFAHANDDRQKDYRSLQQQLRRSSPGTIYWLVTLLSLAWVAGGMVMGHMLFAPEIWEVRSIQQLMATPQILGLIVAIIVPIILFWGFAVMIRRAQEMRLAAQSMTEVAFRLAEPEHLATDRVMMDGQAGRREGQAL